MTLFREYPKKRSVFQTLWFWTIVFIVITGVLIVVCNGEQPLQTYRDWLLSR